jgi:hypothetical protein
MRGFGKRLAVNRAGSASMGPSLEADAPAERALLRDVFGQSAFVIGGGLLGGLTLAILAAWQVQTLLFDLEPADP